MPITEELQPTSREDTEKFMVITSALSFIKELALIAYSADASSERQIDDIFEKFYNKMISFTDIFSDVYEDFLSTTDADKERYQAIVSRTLTINNKYEKYEISEDLLKILKKFKEHFINQLLNEPHICRVFTLYCNQLIHTYDEIFHIHKFKHSFVDRECITELLQQLKDFQHTNHEDLNNALEYTISKSTTLELDTTIKYIRPETVLRGRSKQTSRKSKTLANNIPKNTSSDKNLDEVDGNPATVVTKAVQAMSTIHTAGIDTEVPSNTP